jgi:hypothetical protein
VTIALDGAANLVTLIPTEWKVLVRAIKAGEWAEL